MPKPDRRANHDTLPARSGYSGRLQSIVQDRFQRAEAGSLAFGEAGFELVAQGHELIDLIDFLPRHFFNPGEIKIISGVFDDG